MIDSGLLGKIDSITIINNKVFGIDNNTFNCSFLYYKLMKNFIKERKLDEKI